MTGVEQPVARARTGQGEIWDDPSIDMLFELLGDLERGDESNFSVERLDGRPGVFHIRAVGGAFTLQRYGESTAGVITASTSDKRWAHAVLVDWLYAIPSEAHEVHGWETELRWETIVDDRPPRRRRFRRP